MGTWKTAFVPLLVVLLLSPCAWAENILYFNDASLGTDRMATALSNLGGTHSTTSTSSTSTFTTQLATGNYDLAIFFQQQTSGSSYDTAIAALGTFIDGGGRGILADWTRNNTHAAHFDATFTGGTNQSQITVTEANLAAGITNPITLQNPGWSVFSTGLNGSSIAATFANLEGAIVIGNNSRSILNGFLSDTFVDGAAGVRLYENEIGFLLNGGAAAVPLPIAAPAGFLLLGMLAARRAPRDGRSA